jgi:putative heme-binding domain-containing protein
VLATDPHPRDTRYALRIPASVQAEVVYSLDGVEVSWDKGTDDNPAPELVAWWPSLDSGLAERVLAGSAIIDALRARVAKGGRLQLKTLLALPKGKSTLLVQGSMAFEATCGGETAKSQPAQGGGHEARLTANVEVDVIDLGITLRPLPQEPLRISATINGQPIARNVYKLTWAPPPTPGLPPSPVPPSMLSGGDAAKGKLVFKSEAAKCATCHKFRGDGGEVGPDLTSLVHRDRAWIYRNIAEPSAVIHSDFMPYTVLLKDGRVLVGIIRAEGADTVKVFDTEAKATVVSKIEIEELKPSATSIMPVGLIGPIGEDGVRDLIAFLSSS